MTLVFFFLFLISKVIIIYLAYQIFPFTWSHIDLHCSIPNAVFCLHCLFLASYCQHVPDIAWWKFLPDVIPLCFCMWNRIGRIATSIQNIINVSSYYINCSFWVFWCIYEAGTGLYYQFTSGCCYHLIYIVVGVSPFVLFFICKECVFWVFGAYFNCSC